jgi:hypothetical protein
LAIDTFSGSEGIVGAAVALIPKHHELSGREGGPRIIEIRWRHIDIPVAEPGGSEVPA